MSDYKLHKSKDIIGNDYVFIPNKSIEELKKMCDDMQDSIGFNSLGYIKRDIGSFKDVQNVDFYLNTKRYKSGLQSKKDIASNNIKKNITFVTTTCKRLWFFERTMDAFLNQCTDLYVIDKWLCIDDNSSQIDRDIMKEKYPFFEFVLKTPEQKGHPQSLNIMLERVNTKYVFLLEDDWETSEPFSLTTYINFLEENNYDQIVFRKFWEEAHPQIKVINKNPVFHYLYSPYHPQKNTLVPAYKEKYIEYEKEFDVYTKFPTDNGGNYYPGFGLNPCVFSLDKIKNNNLTFNESKDHHSTFEVYFAFQCLFIANMRIAFSKISIDHIGDRNSAYVLNDENRCFDNFDINLKPRVLEVIPEEPRIVEVIPEQPVVDGIEIIEIST